MLNNVVSIFHNRIDVLTLTMDVCLLKLLNTDMCLYSLEILKGNETFNFFLVQAHEEIASTSKSLTVDEEKNLRQNNILQRDIRHHKP